MKQNNTKQWGEQKQKKDTSATTANVANEYEEEGKYKMCMNWKEHLTLMECSLSAYPIFHVESVLPIVVVVVTCVPIDVYTYGTTATLKE